STISCSSRG
ncbi:acrB/AcrD/AcrF family protein, partial [Vibrio parahaemolyticus V-223/04]